MIFTKKQDILLKELFEKPLFSRYDLSFEAKLDFAVQAKYHTYFRINRCLLYDSMISNVLMPSEDFEFLQFESSGTNLRTVMPQQTTEYIKEYPRSSISAVKAITGAGSLLATVTMELHPIKTTYFRKALGLWELLALTGGFAVTLVALAQLCLRTCATNQNYHISQKHLKSEF